MTSFAGNGRVTNLFWTKKASNSPLLSFKTKRQSTEVVFAADVSMRVAEPSPSQSSLGATAKVGAAAGPA